jgi:hypothetical protein
MKRTGSDSGPFLLECPDSDLVNSTKGEFLFQFFREFFTKIHYVVGRAAFTAAQVDFASGSYDH